MQISPVIPVLWLNSQSSSCSSACSPFSLFERSLALRVNYSIHSQATVTSLCSSSRSPNEIWHQGMACHTHASPKSDTHPFRLFFTSSSCSWKPNHLLAVLYSSSTVAYRTLYWWLDYPRTWVSRVPWEDRFAWWDTCPDAWFDSLFSRIHPHGRLWFEAVLGKSICWFPSANNLRTLKKKGYNLCNMHGYFLRQTV